MAKADLTAQRLRELLDYDPLTGEVRWRNRPGVLAGNLEPNGYISICIDLHREKAHRLAWVYMTGARPKGLIDHIDGDPSNNRWINLRDASHAVNIQNQRKAHKDNASGLLGVSLHKEGRWRAQIRCGSTRRSLGIYPTPEAAHAAYLAAKRAMHPGCTI